MFCICPLSKLTHRFDALVFDRFHILLYGEKSKHSH